MFKFIGLLLLGMLLCRISPAQEVEITVLHKPYGFAWHIESIGSIPSGSFAEHYKYNYSTGGGVDLLYNNSKLSFCLNTLMYDIVKPYNNRELLDQYCGVDVFSVSYAYKYSPRPKWVLSTFAGYAYHNLQAANSLNESIDIGSSNYIFGIDADYTVIQKTKPVRIKLINKQKYVETLLRLRFMLTDYRFYSDLEGTVYIFSFCIVRNRFGIK